MIPELSYSSYISETASTGCEPMTANIPANLPSAKPQRESYSMEAMASSYLHRIPSRSRQWEMYLGDLLDSKIKRSQRAQRETEDINDFLKRFPLYEGPQ